MSHLKTSITLLSLLLLTSCNQCSNQQSSTPQATTEAESEPQGLIIEDLSPGTGPEVKAGDKVSVHYLGQLTNGNKFDSSYDRQQAFDFKVGASQVIKGWDQGVLGMKTGGKRKLTIPPELGYGSAGAGGIIPPNATLVFEVELLKIHPDK